MTQKPVSFFWERTFKEVKGPDGKKRTIGHSNFAVVVTDEAMEAVAQTSPLRAITIRFNNAASPARKLRALADSMEELENLALVNDETKRPGWWKRLAGLILHRLLP